MPVQSSRPDPTRERQAQERLEQLIQARDSKSRQVKRAYALLTADENGDKKWPDQQIKQTYGLSIGGLERLRERLVTRSLDIALMGKKQEVFKEKPFTGEVEAKRVALRCSQCPEGYNRWTLQLLADQMVSLGYVEHMSDESVGWLLKKPDLALANQKLGDCQGRCHLRVADGAGARRVRQSTLISIW